MIQSKWRISIFLDFSLAASPNPFGCWSATECLIWLWGCFSYSHFGWSLFWSRNRKPLIWFWTFHLDFLVVWKDFPSFQTSPLKFYTIIREGRNFVNFSPLWLIFWRKEVVWYFFFHNHSWKGDSNTNKSEMNTLVVSWVYIQEIYSVWKTLLILGACLLLKVNVGRGLKDVDDTRNDDQFIFTYYMVTRYIRGFLLVRPTIFWKGGFFSRDRCS